MLLPSLFPEMFVPYNLFHPLSIQLYTLCFVQNVLGISFFVPFTLNLSLFLYFTCVSYLEHIARFSLYFHFDNLLFY